MQSAKSVVSLEGVMKTVDRTGAESCTVEVWSYPHISSESQSRRRIRTAATLLTRDHEPSRGRNLAARTACEITGVWQNEQKQNNRKSIRINAIRPHVECQWLGPTQNVNALRCRFIWKQMYAATVGQYIMVSILLFFQWINRVRCSSPPLSFWMSATSFKVPVYRLC